MAGMTICIILLHGDGAWGGETSEGAESSSVAASGGCIGEDTCSGGRCLGEDGGWSCVGVVSGGGCVGGNEGVCGDGGGGLVGVFHKKEAP